MRSSIFFAFRDLFLLHVCDRSTQKLRVDAYQPLNLFLKWMRKIKELAAVIQLSQTPQGLILLRLQPQRLIANHRFVLIGSVLHLGVARPRHSENQLCRRGRGRET